MAPPERSSHRPLRRLLHERPQRFEFFEAVRLLERYLPGRTPVGGDSAPGDEAIRFSARATLTFPTGDIDSIELPEQTGDAARMKVNFMGLASPNSFGSLPTPYLSLVLDELRHGRTSLRDFLDVFTHRFVSLFYRAWGKSRLPVAAEHPRESDFERALFALIGMGTSALRHRLPLTDTHLLSRAGLLLRRPASGLALEALIESYFDVSARVEPFQRTEAEIQPEDRTRLGRANGRLGEDTVLGSRIVLRDARFRVVLGPLTRAEHEAFLPHGDAHAALCRLVRLAITSELEFDVQLVLRAPEVPRLRLARDQPPTRLGRSTWLLRAHARSDRGDAIVTPPPDLLPSRTDGPARSARAA